MLQQRILSCRPNQPVRPFGLFQLPIKTMQKGGTPDTIMNTILSALSEDLGVIETNGGTPRPKASFVLEAALASEPDRERPFGQLLAFGEGIVFLVGPQFDGVPGAEHTIGPIVRLNQPSEFSEFNYIPLDQGISPELNIKSIGLPQKQVPACMRVEYDLTCVSGTRGVGIVPKERIGPLMFFLVKHLPHQYESLAS